jgi:hypothetical protein
MTNKNSAVPLVWLAGLLLAVSLVFPNGPQFARPAKPETPPVVVQTEPKIVSILLHADPADKARVVDVYTALSAVLKRPAVQSLIITTEQWAQLQERTLNIAIDEPGKYKELDEAIESLFLAKLGTDDVLAGNPETLARLADACDVVANSAAVVPPPEK